jgi:hypothetical protein
VQSILAIRQTEPQRAIALPKLQSLPFFSGFLAQVAISRIGALWGVPAENA